MDAQLQPLLADAHLGPKPGLSFANPHSLANKLGRLLWQPVWLIFFRLSPRFTFGWRNFLLRCFGAKIGPRCAIYPSCRIWAPWNLEMGEQSCLSFDVDCYCVDKIRIGNFVTVSQYAFLCTASHDIGSLDMALKTASIHLADRSWVCADVFVAPGVTMGEGSVAAAGAVVVRDVPAWNVVGGNPARFIKIRRLPEA
jgi:putative colanic acid biosynthesis acetyltransferase WcaF